MRASLRDLAATKSEAAEAGRKIEFSSLKQRASAQDKTLLARLSRARPLALDNNTACV
jgi:hypothetical protein